MLDAGKRLYSSIWDIAVRCDAGSLRYVVKEAGDRARHQVELSRRADLLFADDPSVASSNLVYIAGLGLVIGRTFEGPSLDATMTWQPRRNPLRQYRSLRRRLARAGGWLAHYHAAASVPPCGTPLLAYIENRRAVLAELPDAVRERMLEVACEPFETNFTVVHGDFRAGNILLDDERLCASTSGSMRGPRCRLGGTWHRC